MGQPGWGPARGRTLGLVPLPSRECLVCAGWCSARRARVRVRHEGQGWRSAVATRLLEGDQEPRVHAMSGDVVGGEGMLGFSELEVRFITMVV